MNCMSVLALDLCCRILSLAITTKVLFEGRHLLKWHYGSTTKIRLLEPRTKLNERTCHAMPARTVLQQHRRLLGDVAQCPAVSAKAPWACGCTRLGIVSYSPPLATTSCPSIDRNVVS